MPPGAVFARDPFFGWVTERCLRSLAACLRRVRPWGLGPFLRWPGAADARSADGVMSGRFEPHPAWNMEPSEHRVFGSSAGNAVRMGSAGAAGHNKSCRRTQKEPVMGLGKKAKREAKAVKGKTKKDARKVKHKGKKAKNAARR